MTTVTILSGPERRRRWTSAEKLQIVEETLAPGASVVEVARRHDVHRNLVTAWRRQARTGVLACGPEPMQRQDDQVRFAAVSIAAPDRQPLTAPSGSCGAIEIEFAAGARMRITGAVDAATLSAVVAALTDGRPR
ncbi:IS66-like element accessory protein TnpA [Bradyrhizobium liaoningense]